MSDQTTSHHRNTSRRDSDYLSHPKKPSNDKAPARSHGSQTAENPPTGPKSSDKSHPAHRKGKPPPAPHDPAHKRTLSATSGSHHRSDKAAVSTTKPVPRYVPPPLFGAMETNRQPKPTTTFPPAISEGFQERQPASAYSNEQEASKNNLQASVNILQASMNFKEGILQLAKALDRDRGSLEGPAGGEKRRRVGSGGWACGEGGAEGKE